MNNTYRIMKVSNGWILDDFEYSNPVARIDKIYVFLSSKELGEFISKLDDKKSGKDESK